MTLREFQIRCNETMLESCKNSKYLTLGLASEVGEIAGVVKKFIRGDMDEDELHERLVSESGDVMWYLVMILMYVTKNTIDDHFENLIYNEPMVTLTTIEIYDLIKSTSTLVSCVEYTHPAVINQVSKIMVNLSKICDLQVAMSTVIEKLSKRKIAGTLHGDGEGVRDGES